MSNEKQNNANAESHPFNMGGVIGGLSFSRDFTEDFQHENGYYQNECIICHQTFLGYKYRRICKECVIANSNPPSF
jgi:hypothetical protein